jgi:hypothetical protein
MKELLVILMAITLVSAFVFAGYVFGAVIGTLLILFCAVVFSGFLIFLAIESLWGVLKSLFKRKTK